VVAEPRLEAGDGGDFEQGLIEPIEDGRELRGIGEVDGLGKKWAGREVGLLHSPGMPWKSATPSPSSRHAPNDWIAAASSCG
jgi:hypothetical protein